MRRAIRAASVALTLVAATLSVAWVLLYLRPLPTIDGRYRLLGLDAEAEILRDRFGTPHIYAADLHDLYFLQGYATAQDRLAQMEAMREGALGVAARPAAQAVARARQADRAVIEAYAAGVTKLIHQLAAARALPPEVALRGRVPDDWTPNDVAAVAAVYLDHLDRSSVCSAAPAQASARGRPVFAADIYVEAPDPGWYEVGLDDPDTHAVGISLPGVPGIVTGHNGWVAWTLLSSARPETGAGAVAVAPTAVDTVNGVTHAMGARTAAAFTGSLEQTEVAACVADIYGHEGGNDRERAAFLPPDRPLVFGGGGGRRDAGLMDALRQARSVDPEAMRLILGPAASTFPGARAIVDLASTDLSKAVVSEGASGLRASPHFRDQAPLWEMGQLRALPRSREAIGLAEGDLIFRPR